ncbi:helix-turn-helix transcriptional regulator [Actinospica sp. MGRD01-02]|uniref:Helix-turn-helix transcriptional regulator n=2 Tax=Actinospica acidithermotolerans TaxID=2828514 RepID=A0A941ELS8_9ACTN|nr:helix-turn-helix transcriptional regulator [Actinospica acidithermotolerans]
MDERERETRFNLEMGSRIRALRGGAGLVQAQLAQMAGVSRASISNIEAGSQAPPPYRLARIAHALNVSVGELIPATTEISPPPLTSEFADALASVMAQADRLSEDGEAGGQG